MGSNKFLSATGRWTKRVEAACNFTNVVNAIHTCLGKNFCDVELVLRFEGDATDRRISLTAIESVPQRVPARIRSL
jgi:hypothetical protein